MSDFWNPMKISANPMNGVAYMPPLVLAVGGAAAATWGGLVVGGAVSTIGALSAFSSFLVRAALGVALYALSPKPQPPGASTAASGYTITTSGTALDHAVIYGRSKVGGVRIYDETSGTNNTTLHRVLAFAGHEIDAFETIYVNDEVVTVDGSGNVTSPARYSGKMRIHSALGSPDQLALPVMVSRAPSWTADHRLRGIAYLYVEMDYSTDTFPNGVPEITAVIRGKKVFDPRTSVTQWSDNAALCIRDYLVSDFGLSCVAQEIDDTLFQVAANKCDETVAGIKRYACDGVFTTDVAPVDVLQSMLTSCGGLLWWAQGEWRVKVASYTTPVMALTQSDYRGEIQVTPKTSRRENFNVVKGVFRGAETNWQNTDYTSVKEDVFVTEDGGRETTSDYNLPFTSKNLACQRIAKISLRRAREQISVQGRFGIRCLQLQVGDNVTLTNDRYGWVDKPFEVVNWSLYFTDDYKIGVQMSLREISSAVFDDTPGEALILNNTNLPSAFDVATVGIALTESLRLVNEAVISVVTLTTNVSSPTVDLVEVEYKPTASSQWIRVGRGEIGSFEILGLSDGFYDFRARGINLLGVRAPTWTQVLNRYVSPFLPPPSQVQNFLANVVSGAVHLSWDPVPDLDLSHYRVKYSPLTNGASYSDAIEIVERVARPANSVVVPAQTGTYFIKAVDKLGTPSIDFASVVVFTDASNIQNLNVVETLQESPTFAGTLSGVSVVEYNGTPALILGTTTLFDAMPGNFDATPGLFDGGNGTVRASGTYQFSQVVDLGQKYTSRVTQFADIRRQSNNFGFDETLGMFDDAQGLFDGEADSFDQTRIQIQMSYTDDDPTGTPTWSPWVTFFVSDVSARAFRFRAVLETFDSFVSPVVVGLSATVDMPDRVESQENVSFTGSTTITFPQAFKNVPALGVSVANLSSGQRYAIVSKSRTGFTIDVLNSDNSPGTNAVQMDYVAKGYGRQMV